MEANRRALAEWEEALARINATLETPPEEREAMAGRFREFVKSVPLRASEAVEPFLRRGAPHPGYEPTLDEPLEGGGA